jgi:hypothetical protein
VKDFMGFAGIVRLEEFQTVHARTSLPDATIQERE